MVARIRHVWGGAIMPLELLIFCPVVVSACVSGTALVGEQSDREDVAAERDLEPDPGLEGPDEGPPDAPDETEPDIAEDAFEVDPVDATDTDARLDMDEAETWELLPESCDRLFESDISCYTDTYWWICPGEYRYCCFTSSCGELPLPTAAGCCRDRGCALGPGFEYFYRCHEAIGEQTYMPDGCGPTEPSHPACPGGSGPPCPAERPYCCFAPSCHWACSDHLLFEWVCQRTDGDADAGASEDGGGETDAGGD